MGDLGENARPSGFPAPAANNNSLPTLEHLLSLPPGCLDRYDIAEVNLACAAGLPGAEGLNVSQCLATLDRWAKALKRYTRDAMWEYQREPERFERHRGFFRFSVLVTFLKHPRSLGVRYQPSAIANFDFSDSRDDLLHGLLTRRLGTCTSLPVLFVALGRRLGYPMHLAVAKQHVFCQWVDADGSRANLEGSNGAGGEMLPDERYHSWPRPLTRDNLASGRYLRPLTRGEEFGLFLETRGHCLADNGRYDEAQQAYAQARDVSAGWSQYEGHLYSLSLLRARAIPEPARRVMVSTLPGLPWQQVVTSPIFGLLSF